MTNAKQIERPGSPKMPKNILFKLFGFTIVLFILPVLSFFVSKNLIFQKNGEVYSGIVAVIMANLVILVYIWAVFDEENDIPAPPPKKLKSNDKKKNDGDDETKSQDSSENKSNGDHLRQRKQ